MIDLSTKAGVLRFAELRRAEMTRCFERLGRFEVGGYSVCAHVFLTHAVLAPSDPSRGMGEWRTGPRLPSVRPELVVMPRAASMLVPAERLSALFAETVRRHCALGRAVGVVVMNEMWWGRTKSFGERRERPPRIEDWDDRREVLYLSLEHKAVGSRAWRAEIRREVDPPARLEPWEDAGPAVAGILTGLVDLAEWRS